MKSDSTRETDMELMDDDKGAVAQALTDYYAAFSTLDAHAVAPYFHEPSLLVSPAGVGATPTRAAVIAVFQPAMDALRARGFAKSELTNLRLKRLSAASVIAGGVAVRRQGRRTRAGEERRRVLVAKDKRRMANRRDRDPRRGRRAPSRVGWGTSIAVAGAWRFLLRALKEQKTTKNAQVSEPVH